MPAKQRKKAKKQSSKDTLASGSDTLSNGKTRKSGSSLWNKAFGSDTDWDKEDISDVIYWLRQILSVALGLIWGILPLVGFLPVLLYFIVSVLALDYYKSWVGASDEVFSRLDSFKEGLAPGFGSFMLVWIITYSNAHF